MKFLLLVECFLLGWIYVAGDLCDVGAPEEVAGACHKYECSSDVDTCPKETFFDEDSEDCKPLNEYVNSIEVEYDKCRCGNTDKLGYVVGSKNNNNEFLYCLQGGTSARYTCDNIPSSQTKPEECMCPSGGSAVEVQGKCNLYKCGSETKSCDKDYYFDSSSKACLPFSTYQPNTESDKDSCTCSSSQFTGLVSGSKNSENKYLYCTSEGASRRKCSEIPSNEKPDDCSVCEDGTPPSKVKENCAQFRCGLDPKIYSCPRGQHFLSTTKQCEEPSYSLTNLDRFN